jgi:hypothetical protein
MSTLIQITKPTELIVNNTPIIGGVDGRVLFEGTGNVLQQSANLFWDNTNGRLGIGTATPTTALSVTGSEASGRVIQVRSSAGKPFVEFFTTVSIGVLGSATAVTGGSANDYGLGTNGNATANLIFGTGAGYSERMRIFGSTGNLAINTTTDAGFRLDVNGTARVQGLLTGTNGINISGGNSNVYGLTFNSGGIGATGQGLWTDGKTNIQQSQGPRTNGGAAYLLTAYVGGNYDTIQLVNNGTTNCLLIQGGYASSNQPQFNVNILNLNNTYNFTTGTTVIKGIYYNPVLTSMTGVTAHHAFHSTSGRIRFEGLPTSSAGLSAGEIWNDGGTIRIV